MSPAREAPVAAPRFAAAHGRHYPVLLGLELALIVAPSTGLYLSLLLALLADSRLSSSTWSPPALIVPFGGFWLALVWYAAFRFLIRGRAGLAVIHPALALVGAVGLAWVAFAWMLRLRIDSLGLDSDGNFYLFIGACGILATPAALVGLHLLIEWCMARHRGNARSTPGTD